MRRVVDTFFGGSLRQAVAAHLAQRDTDISDEEFKRLETFEAHEMRIGMPLVPSGRYLVYCTCGDAQRVEAFDRSAPDGELAGRITVAYRQHLKDTP